MRSGTSRPIRLAVAVAAAGMLTLTACGSDSGGSESSGGGESSGSGSTDAFCEELGTLAESDADTTPEQDLADIRAVAAVAPDEISDEMTLLVDGFEKLQAFDAAAASEEEQSDFLALAAAFEEASTKIEAFTMENCPDLPADFFSTE